MCLRCTHLEEYLLKLVTKEIAELLPPIGSSDCLPREDKVAVCKFFTPDAGWTWYACEFDGYDLFFGYVIGLVPEWGYFSLSELKAVRGPLGLPIERDIHFPPQSIRPYLVG